MKKLLVVALLAAVSADVSHAQSRSELSAECSEYRGQIATAYDRLADAVLTESVNLRRFRHQLSSTLTSAEGPLNAINAPGVINSLIRARGRRNALRVLREHGFNDSIMIHGQLSSLAEPRSSDLGFNNVTAFKFSSVGNFRTQSGVNYYSDSWASNANGGEQSRIYVRIYDSNLLLGSLDYSNSTSLPVTRSEIANSAAIEATLVSNYPVCRDIQSEATPVAAPDAEEPAQEEVSNKKSASAAK